MQQPLLDFDGPVANTAALLLEICRQVEPGLTHDEMKQFFYGNVLEPVAGQRRLCGVFCHQTYQARITEAAPVEGIDTFLNDLLKHDKKIIFVTSSMTASVEGFLRHYGLPFHEVWGADKGMKKTEKITHVMKRHGLKTKDSIFVTDTVGDVHEARQVGLDSVGITWGLHDREEFMRASTSHIVDTVHELQHHIIGKHRQATRQAPLQELLRSFARTPGLQHWL